MKSKNVHQYLKVISDSSRLQILALLKEGEFCACDIHPKLKIAQNLASHHLKVLKDLSLVKSRKEGVKVIYSRDEAQIKKFQELLSKTI